MKKRNYSRRQLALICFLSIAMLAAAALLNKALPPRSKPVSATPAAAAEKTASQTAVAGQASGASGELETGGVEELSDPTERIATWFQDLESPGRMVGQMGGFRLRWQQIWRLWLRIVLYGKYILFSDGLPLFPCRYV